MGCVYSGGRRRRVIGPWIFAGGVSLLLLAGGCGDTEQVRRNSALVAFESGLFQRALELADAELATQPDHRDLLRLKAGSERQLGLMDACHATWQRMLEIEPDDADVRVELVRWCWARLEMLDRRTARADRKVAEKIERVERTGLDQAEWYEGRSDGRSEASYIRARIADHRLERLQRRREAQRMTLGHDPLGVESGPAGEDELDSSIDSMRRRRDELLSVALEADPLHFPAVELQARVLTEEARWAKFWAFARPYANRVLPDSTVWTLVGGIVATPDAVAPRHERLDIGWQIHEAHRENPTGSARWLASGARLHQLADQWDLAAPLIVRALEIEPGNDFWKYEQARNYFGRKNYREAVAVLKPLYHRIGDVTLRVLYANALEKSGAHRQGRAVIREVLSRDPGNVLARETMLRFMAEQGQLADAESDVFDYAQLRSGDARATLIAMHYHLARGRLDHTLRLLEEVEKIEPLGPDHLRLLVEGYFKLEIAEKAVEYARRLSELEPGRHETRMLLAEALVMGGEHESARALIEQVRGGLPAPPPVDRMMARLHLKCGHYRQAIDLSSAVVREDPADAAARHLLAQALAATGQAEEAIDQLEAVLEAHPADAAAHALLNRFYQFLGDAPRAAHHLAQIDPEEIDEHVSPVLAAQLGLREGDLERALSICNLALAAGHPDPAIHLFLARIYRHRQDTSREELHLRSLLYLRPRTPLVYALIARFYIEQNDPERGITLIEDQKNRAAVPAALALARLLAHAGMEHSGLRRLEAVFEEQVRKGSAQALKIADAIAAIHLSPEMDAPDAARKAYDRLIEADVFAAAAQFRKIMMIADDLKRSELVARLGALGRALTDEKRRLRQAVIEQLIRLDARDESIGLIDHWIGISGETTALLRAKGALELADGRIAPAIATYRQALETAPSNLHLRRRLAQAYERAGDHPAARDVYRGGDVIDNGARMLLLAELARMYDRLGLHRTARATFEAMERLGDLRDHAILYAVASNHERLGRHDLARERLASIPSGAADYVPAQIRLAWLEQRDGLTKDAAGRLSALVRATDDHDAIVRHFLAALSDAPGLSAQFGAVAGALEIEMIAPKRRHEWMRTAVRAAANRHDWPAVLTALLRMDRERPGTLSVMAARVAVLAHLGRREMAIELWHAQPKLQSSPVGHLLATTLELEAPADSVGNAVSAYFAAMADGQVDAAQEAGGRIRSGQYMYGADMIAAAEGAAARTAHRRALLRRLGLAVVCLEVGLPQLAELIGIGVMREAPDLALGHGVFALAVHRQDRSIYSAFSEVLGRIPDPVTGGAIALHLRAVARSTGNDHEGAIADLQALLSREPENAHVHFLLTQILQVAGQVEHAVPYWRRLIESNGPYSIVAANNSGYFMAQLDDRHVPAARRTLRDAVSAAPNNASLRDTLGWIEHLAGNDEEARAHLQHAVAARPDDLETHYHLGVVYAATDEPSMARAHLEHVILGCEDEALLDRAQEALSAMEQ
ncbi:MAG: hypothetical protein CMJ18_26080 [Phycisphaeraceae bacterium]|nr:hypothetical protein [Phycisphaeraceae bacterium]